MIGHRDINTLTGEAVVSGRPMILGRVVAISKDSKVLQLTHQAGEEVFVADSVGEALEMIDVHGPDMIVVDHVSYPQDSLELLSKAGELSLNTPIIAIGNDTESNNLSEQFTRMGAYAFLNGTDDQDSWERILSRLENKNNKSDSLDDRSHFFAADFAASASIVGRRKAMLESLRMIELIARSTCNPVLILGETGTGKELAARAVHHLRHPAQPFIAVNCAALTANLLESELFGHIKGSFTGADREKTGLLELAGSGSIFLDEISEMPLELQAKLLRVLQEKTFRKVGGIEEINCRATIIASSNCNLKKHIRTNRFRRDLYYRLNICPIILSPLRFADRQSDIALLAEHFIKTSTICPDKVDKIHCLTKLAAEALEKHDWPGNVRELRNVIDKAILLETTDKIGLSSIVLDSPDDDDQWSNPIANRTNNIKDFSLNKAERKLITRALHETGWQKTRAAALLGITRATLYAKVRQYNIAKSPVPRNQNPQNIPTSPVGANAVPSEYVSIA